MKAIIVTVYNSHNAGSFLQAFALQTVLRKSGIETAFLKRQDAGSHDFIKLIKVVILQLLQFKIEKAFQYIKTWIVYEKIVEKELSICDKNSNFYKEASLVVLGSDTIWNFDNKYFACNASTYIGKDFSDKKVFSYAASVANSSIVSVKRIIMDNGGIDHLSSVLVRDSYTKNIMENITSKEIKIVTDPTLLLNKDDYLALYNNPKCNFDYLLLYYFNDISEELKIEIRNYANLNHLKIISMPFHRSWCDYNFYSSPQLMVSYFLHAKAVLTNTFHGCALSLIFEKPFAVHNENKNKISDFLSIYGESYRLFSNSSEMIKVLSIPNLVISSGLYDKIRKESLYLLNANL